MVMIRFLSVDRVHMADWLVEIHFVVDAHRELGWSADQAERRALLLHMPHVAPLTTWAAHLGRMQSSGPTLTTSLTPSSAPYRGENGRHDAEPEAR